ncbi:MarR family winged helix-turn-helix transcriptional regulator [Colwellia sp. M166]|uniref:MarR family winged helix-turn-helix transcriptional regulator n=1 Tax=Colwellia sp. M166 TaxID=2583805 RepID=UPI00211E2B7F|nr:MarR family transcriptional regulator [Colwellia sp. M166]
MNLSEHLPYRVAIVSNLLALNRDLNIRSLSNLEPREMRVLLNIGSYMPIKSADIAYQSRLDSSTVSRAVKVLLAKKLIAAKPDSVSKNIKHLTLTELGVTLYKQLSNALEPRAQALESVLNDDEKQVFYQCLTKIEAKAEQLLAQQALSFVNQGLEIPADQKELLRWYKKSQQS